MLMPFEQGPSDERLAAAARELESVNLVIGQHGLSLSQADIQAIVVGRAEALAITERVEFGRGVAREIVIAFAGSPHVSQTNFVDTVLQLQELFYEVKNEGLEQIPDDELIVKMRSLFDGFAGGDVEYLAEALLEGLGRTVREAMPSAEYQLPIETEDESLGFGDEADPDADRAAANAHTLAQHRFDVSNWVDETYDPAWEGSSWLDE